MEASSTYYAAAALELVGYGPMTYSSRKKTWSLTTTVAANPGTITVGGPEGSIDSNVATK